MQNASAALPLNVAICDAILTSASGAALGAAASAGHLVGRVYFGRVPTGAQRPYVQITGMTESDGSLLGRAGNNGSSLLHIYADGDDGNVPLGHYAAIKLAIDGQPLTVAGHTLWMVALDLIDVTPDPNGKMMHLIARMRAWTMNG